MTLDWSSFPLPENAPEPGACWRIERPEPGLLVLVLDPPHRPSLPVFDVPALRDLNLALDEIASDKTAKGLVITGRAPTVFAGGADVETIAKITDPALAAELVRRGQQTYTRIEKMSRSHGGSLFTVAAVGGPVPGGACEITLVCDRTVLADDAKTRIGLPEVRLGILPAWGGTTRLPRRIGVPAAAAAILAGKLHRPRAALKLGIVDRLTKPEYLVRIASDVAMGRLKVERKQRGVWEWLIDKNPLAGMVIESQARKGVLKQTRGKYPAPLAVLPLIIRAPRTPVGKALDAEVDAIRPLVVDPVSKSLITLFQLSEDAKKLGEIDGKKAPKVARGAVVGGGVMGGAIASLMADKGLDARLADLDQDALDRATHAHRADVAKRLKRRQLQRFEADAAIDRFETTRVPEGFARCEILIEAVAEVLAVKRKVLGLYAARMAPDAILATNTSSLSVDAIAAELPHPERVVGMHFFNPVKKMPLVEIIRGAKTTDEVVAKTARLALDLGKTPVVCKDVAGFLVNRLLGPYLDEALRLWEGGADLEMVDRALVDFGMPMGPYELLDEVGLDIASHAAASLHKAYGERMTPSDLLAPMERLGQHGKKSGRGIFVWQEGDKGRLKNAGLNPAAPKATVTSTVTAEQAVDRLILAMLNEAARALAEDVVAGPRELDLATVFGMGFAPFRGGLLRYADTRGLKACVSALRGIADSPAVAQRPGGRARFEPAELLVELAEANRRFHG